MARFLNHTSCSHCGSSDAKALYDDGSTFCFSCKHSTRTTRFSGVSDNGRRVQPGVRSLPDDCCSHFSSDAMGWLSKTGIAVETLIKHGVRYSPSRNQIVFTWKDLDVWQARNCSKEARSRYFTSGNHDNVLPIYKLHAEYSNRCVLTEDCLSAIKCAECFNVGASSNLDAMPLLGSHLSTQKMKGLKRLYKQVDVFLDEDKFADALRLSDRLTAFGLGSRVFLDKRDPKHITYDELKVILNV